MRSFRVLTVVTGVLLGGLVSQAHAAPILAAAAVTANTGDAGGCCPLVNAINQNGLSAGYISGVTDFDAYMAATTHSDPAGGTTSGFSGGLGPSQVFTFDLGAAVAVDALAFWAANNLGTVTQFTLFADSDNIFINGTDQQIGGVFNVSSFATPASAEVLPFSSVTTRFIHLAVLNMAGGPTLQPGIGEVAFREASVPGVPEPASMILMASGLAFVILRRRLSARA